VCYTVYLDIYSSGEMMRGQPGFNLHQHHPTTSVAATVARIQ